MAAKMAKFKMSKRVGRVTGNPINYCAIKKQGGARGATFP